LAGEHVAKHLVDAIRGLELLLLVGVV